MIGSAVSLCALLLGVGATASGASTKTSAHLTSATKVSGGTVTWAEPPSSPPTYIFPFMTAQYDTVDNISQFQYMLYRPLYMFGHPTSTSNTINISDSPANAPTYSNGNTQATITLKGWKWSNGETVSSSDVLFFMNMLHAQKANWYSYVPGLFPDNVTNVVASSPTQVTFTFNKAYSPEWMTYNEFSQITPFPKAWDIASGGAAAGSGGCSSGTYGSASTDAACTSVYNYLTGQSSNIAGYATNPLWAIVDGPFTIAASKGGSFSTSGSATLVPNPSYSGHKATISSLQELPFTTDGAEYDALLGGKVDVGYLPQQDVTKSTPNAVTAGPNNPRLESNFYLTPWVLFGYNYLVLKFNSTGDSGAAGPIFKQLYIRQAMQHLINQPAMISKLLKGYGVPTYGPVPVLPKNTDVDSYEKTNPYPYNPSTAKSLLSSHGWKVVSGGTDTCEKAGTGSSDCGAGIPKGAKLSFTFAYASGTLWQQQVVQIEQSAWSGVGIHVTLAPGTFTTVVGDYAPPCTSGTPCTLEMGWWGGGWEYSPDYYPTGEVLFTTGAGNNSGNYDSSTANALIAKTNDTSANLDNYQNYIAKQLPVVFQPNADYAISEIVKKLQGIAPQNPFANLYPEYWYFTK